MKPIVAYYRVSTQKQARIRTLQRTRQPKKGPRQVGPAVP